MSFGIVIVLAVLLAIVCKSDGVRRARNGEVGGVCAGIAARYEMNVTAVRILWFLWALCIGGGILSYIILWAVLPEEQSQP